MAVALAGVLGGTSAQALETPKLVADIRLTTSAGSDPGPFLTIGAQTFFSADNAATGRELWRTDGTAEGTWLVRDVWPGREGSDPRSFGRLGELLLFFAADGETGAELWRSDGTVAGTWRVADIAPGARDSWWWLENDFSSSPIVEAGGIAYFAAVDGEFDIELWRSDGTAEGTWRVRDDAPAVPESLCAVGDRVLFAAYDESGDRELWMSDGTEQGTQRLADLLPEDSSYPIGLRRIGGSVVFAANGPTGRGVWRADPAVPAVTLLSDDPGIDPWPLHASGNLVYFGSSGDLWRTDGTSDGTWSLGVSLGHPPELAGSDGLAYFEGADAQLSFEPWRSDGTIAGTFALGDLNPKPFGSRPYGFLPLDEGEVLFFAMLGDEASIPVIHRSDGTAPGTTAVDALPEPWLLDVPSGLTKAASAVVFAAGGREGGLELWRTAGFPGTTELLVDLDPATLGSDPEHFLMAGGHAYFYPEMELAFERWRTDGTSEGTEPLEGGAWSDFRVFTTAGETLFGVGDLGLWKVAPGADEPEFVLAIPDLVGGGSRPAAVDWNGELWFLANESVGALWRSDGTAEGTEPVYEAAGWLGSTSELQLAGQQLYLRGGDGELWASDGTSPGTRRVRDIVPGPEGPFVKSLVASGARVFFLASTGEDESQELWVSDGTEPGTLVIGAIDGDWPERIELVPLADGVLFARGDAASGREPWWSDGTPGGTRLLEIAEGPAASNPRELVRIGEIVFFTANDGVHGRELWKSDGTTEGTMLVRDIAPGPAGSSARALAGWGARLVFTACDDEAGCEPWTSDGTAEGTQRLANLYPGQIGSDPDGYASDGVRLAFAANSPEAGREVWWAPEPDAGAAAGAAIAALALLARRPRARW